MCGGGAHRWWPRGGAKARWGAGRSRPLLCSACDSAEVSILCCANDVALYARRDREVHAANRLAGKHQRLPLLAPGGQSAAVAPPKCDICQVRAPSLFALEMLFVSRTGPEPDPPPLRVQECDAYFFCLEDRALLCRSCDVAMHTANALVSAHRRFLLLPGIAGAVASPAGEERPGAPIHDV